MGGGGVGHVSLISALDRQLCTESALPTGIQLRYQLVNGLGGPDRWFERFGDDDSSF
jgi:hypothetical protein